MSDAGRPGRPYKRGLDYFPHETGALTDDKITLLVAQHGAVGYAVYFALLEEIYQTDDFELNCESFFGTSAVSSGCVATPSGCVSDADPCRLDVVRLRLRCRPDVVRRILTTATRLGLFSLKAWTDRKVLTSDAIKRRGSTILQERLRKRGQKPQNEFFRSSSRNNGGETPEQCRNNGGIIGETKVTKVNEDQSNQIELTTKGNQPENPAIGHLVKCFDFCKMPGPATKRAAIEDAIRQGANPGEIERAAMNPGFQTLDFFSIVRTMVPKVASGLTATMKKFSRDPDDFSRVPPEGAFYDRADQEHC